MNKVEKPRSTIKQNKVNVSIFQIIFNVQFIISDYIEPVKVLGKKRFKENNGKEKSEKNNNIKTFNVFFNLTKQNINKEISKEDLNNLYDIKRNACFQCVQINNKKYANNEFIPTICF